MAETQGTQDRGARHETIGAASAAYSSPTRVTLVDTHAHLAWPDFAVDLEAVIERATAGGVERLLAVGVDDVSSRASVAIARHASVFAAVGLHPNECANHDSAFPAIAALARTGHHGLGGRIVALGETGLDAYRDRVAPVVQEESFRRHLLLAAELDLPVVIHNRQADEAILRMLHAGPAGLRGVLHCFSGDWALAEACLQRGFYLSFAGNLTYRSAPMLRDVAGHVPLERLLTETDAPFLPPHPWRGKRNEPAYVAETLRVLAEAQGVDQAMLARQVATNARDLFHW